MSTKKKKVKPAKPEKSAVVSLGRETDRAAEINRLMDLGGQHMAAAQKLIRE